MAFRYRRLKSKGTNTWIVQFRNGDVKRVKLPYFYRNHRDVLSYYKGVARFAKMDNSLFGDLINRRRL